MLPAGTSCPASAPTSASRRPVRSNPCMSQFSRVIERTADKTHRPVTLFSTLLAGPQLITDARSLACWTA